MPRRSGVRWCHTRGRGRFEAGAEPGGELRCLLAGPVTSTAMEGNMRRSALGMAAAAALLLAGGAAVSGLPSWVRTGAVEQSAEVSGTVPLEDVVNWALACRTSGAAGCDRIVYFWSSLMPLSRAGTIEIRRAAAELGVEVAIVDAAELEEIAGRSSSTGSGTEATTEDEVLAAEMIQAGATLHQPSLLVYTAGRLAGPAILGYKRGEAYRSLIAERLAGGAAAELPPAPLLDSPPLPDTLESSRDYPIRGRPGAYFRSVPGRATLAYEQGGTIYLLDLASGETSTAPGFIDFVPTPDGRFFVTPAEQSAGLAFYDAHEVFAAGAAGNGWNVEPIYVDRELRDQYPSVGILASEPERIVYRVLTSWFSGITFRDYEIRTDGGDPRVRPLGGRVTACQRLSIPILGPDGQEVAGRDEQSATTKIFALDANGGCREVADLGLQSGKVAWSPDGRRLAFAIPSGAVRDGTGTLWIGERNASLSGIFVYDRENELTTQLVGSEEAHRLTFPDFVGADSIAFLLAPEASPQGSTFRVVCCVR